MKNYSYNHPYHLVTYSPWPLLMSLSIFITMTGSLIMFNYKNFIIFFIGLISILLCKFQWWRDIIRESTFQGMHTKIIITLMKTGMLMFIISEVFFFISLFWSYFHSALSPNIEIGTMWPPQNISSINPFTIPTLNTIILLTSGFTITWSHHLLLINKKKSMYPLLITIMLGLFFSYIQFFEYSKMSFCMSDSIYGSLFYMMTGFHGLHVIIGSLFLLVTLMRMMMNHLTMTHHFNFEASSWYWHFVDVVWIFVFSLVYWWNY
uniref:Cytochrome c oxidase subunit 3 n=1 Tax=Aegilips sp. ZJUH 20220002 TaxID=2943451 RepID=A0A9E8JZU8_9HYME|nr:cytochrome c oxidase subunit 3 [Aegilips sp. ZJUH 20220002]